MWHITGGPKYFSGVNMSHINSVIHLLFVFSLSFIGCVLKSSLTSVKMMLNQGCCFFFIVAMLNKFQTKQILWMLVSFRLQTGHEVFNIIHMFLQLQEKKTVKQGR